MDLFKRRLPSFNMRGKVFIPSIAGGVLSFSIFYVLLLYAAVKLIQLVSRANPNVSSYEQLTYFDSDNVMNLKDSGLRFAFAIEGYLDH